VGGQGEGGGIAAEVGAVMRLPTRVVAAAVFAAVVVVGPMTGDHYQLLAQNAQVKDLLPKIADYIQSFITGFSNVVAEEAYKQQISSPRRNRQLKSDLMLVKYPGADGWLIFRDTFEVDGKSVRSEPERLTKLFVEPPENAFRRAREITSASAKFNLANIGTINNPLMVLALMQDMNQPRFRFTLGNIEKSLGPDVRVVQFQEFQSPSLIKVDGNADIFTNGLLWVEQATGRIVKTQLNLGKRGSGIQIETRFRADPDLQIDVPASLKEWYPDGYGGDITGEASYTRFRRFQVTTDEEIKK
jgi:hypothetical protein